MQKFGTPLQKKLTLSVKRKSANRLKNKLKSWFVIGASFLRRAVDKAPTALRKKYIRQAFCSPRSYYILRPKTLKTVTTSSD